MLSFLPKSSKEIQEKLQTHFKTRRKELKFTQLELSECAGVSLGSLKRFELTGQISLESLLKLAFVLECLRDFGMICQEKEKHFSSIEEVLE